MEQPKTKGALNVAYGAMFFEGALNSILTAYMVLLALHFDCSKVEVTQLITMRSIGVLLTTYISGKLSDRLGRKVLVLVGGVFFILFTTGIIFTNHLEVAIWFALLGGMAHGFMDAPGMSILLDLYPQNAGPAMSLVQVFFSAGAVLITMSSSVFIHQGYDWRLAFGFFSLFGIFFLFLAFQAKYPQVYKANKESLETVIEYKKQPTMWREGLLLLAVTILTTAVLSLFTTWIQLYANEVKGLDESQSALLLSLFQVGGVLGSLWISRILRKVHPTLVMAVLPVIAAAFWLLLLAADHWLFIDLASIVIGGSIGVYFGLAITMGGELFYKNAGSISGLISTSSGVSGIIVVALSRELLKSLRIPDLYLFCFVLLFVLFICAVLFRYYVKQISPKRI
ncbi:MAG: MFS transporter [Erysipelotrichaceae bacterium]|jgi:predicted MFS family arabinose efflux permease|nr:MFS transporter [Erysipelotrichaceae bacterium]